MRETPWETAPHGKSPEGAPLIRRSGEIAARERGRGFLCRPFRPWRFFLKSPRAALAEPRLPWAISGRPLGAAEGCCLAAPKSLRQLQPTAAPNGSPCLILVSSSTPSLQIFFFSESLQKQGPPTQTAGLSFHPHSIRSVGSNFTPAPACSTIQGKVPFLTARRI